MSKTATQHVALVTGAARGIGRAIAERFHAEGWNVALLDIDAATLAQTEAAFGDAKRVLAITADVSIAAEVDKAMARVKSVFGRLDALVNNAGVAEFLEIHETRLPQWQRIMDVNLTGPHICVQAALPLMQVTGGAVCNITSISGLRASTKRAGYGTSKAALAHLTQQQAVELAPAIRVNAVAPGPVETAMAAKVHTPEIRAAYAEAIPMERYGTEAEIAAAVWWLCSPESSYVTGVVLPVDGGFGAAGIGLPALRQARTNKKDTSAV